MNDLKSFAVTIAVAVVVVIGPSVFAQESSRASRKVVMFIRRLGAADDAGR